MKTTCQSCGKPRAGGGHRFCRACLAQILCTPAPAEQPAWTKQSTYTYPPTKKGGKR